MGSQSSSHSQLHTSSHFQSLSQILAHWLQSRSLSAIHPFSALSLLPPSIFHHQDLFCRVSLRTGACFYRNSVKKSFQWIFRIEFLDWLLDFLVLAGLKVFQHHSSCYQYFSASLYGLNSTTHELPGKTMFWLDVTSVGSNVSAFYRYSPRFLPLDVLVFNGYAVTNSRPRKSSLSFYLSRQTLFSSGNRTHFLN